MSKGRKYIAKEENTADQAKCVVQNEQMEGQGSSQGKRKYSADGKKTEDDYRYVSFGNDNREGY